MIFVHLIQIASSLPTDVSALESSISALERDIASLDKSSIPLERLLPWFTGLVALGVLMDLWVIRHEYRDERKVWGWGRGTIRPPERPSTKKLVVGVISILFITGGIVGELCVGLGITSINGKLRSKNSELRSDSDLLLALVTQRAGDAATSAKIAREEADAVAKLAAAQGSRAKLLAKAAPKLAGQLAPFARQRVGLFVCGKQGTQDQETLDTWGVIANILGPDTVSGTAGARWKEIPKNLNFADGCGAARGLGQGVIVFVSKHASRKTMEAANALGHGLAEALPPSPNKMPSLIDPDFAKLEVDRGFKDKNAPWVSVGLDPDLITVLIGAHP